MAENPDTLNSPERTEKTPPGVVLPRTDDIPSIPDHELIRCVGEGSYGQVWLARNVVGTYRAVKIVYRKKFTDETPFQREFSGIQKFEPISRSQNGLVHILHIGRNDAEGFFYYVMELADDANAVLPDQSGSGAVFNPETYSAKTLWTEMKRRGRLPCQECVSLGLSLSSTLEYLHQSGLVHRDIKPSNIIFVNGQPKLADIGLVTEIADAFSFVGTEGFIPPEGPGTSQADVYSLGKVLYEISSGKDRNAFPEPPTQLGEFGDRRELLELDEVIQLACDSEPRRRYKSAQQMHDDLALLGAGKSVRHLRGRRRAIVCTALTIMFGLALFLSPLFQHLERLSFDTLSGLVPKSVPTEAVILYLDKESHSALKQPYNAPWDRSLYARLVERLAKENARACVFDIIFAPARRVETPGTRLVPDAGTSLRELILASQYDAVLLSLGGTVKVVKRGTTNRIPAERKMPLSVGDKVWTGSNSSALVIMSDDTILRVNQFTQLTISPPRIESAKSSVDQRLAESFQSFGKVVLAADSRPPNEVFPLHMFMEAAAGIGDANVTADPDLAKTVTLVPEGFGPIPSLAQAAAAVAKGTSPASIVDRSPKWLKFYADIPTVSYHKALDTDALPAGFFSNKVVFVGAYIEPTSVPKQDPTRIPMGLRKTSEGLRPDTFILATAFLNIIRGEALTRMPLALELSLSFLLACMVSVGISLLPTRIGLCATVLTLLAIVVSTWLLFFSQHVWFAWALTVSLVFFAVAWNLVGRRVKIGFRL